MTQALTKELHPHTRTGDSRLGVYATAHKDMYNHPDGALPAESNACWEAGVSASVIRIRFKAMTGTLWNAKLARRYGRAYLVRNGRIHAAEPVSSGLCPLCRKADGVGHMTGECEHTRMKALFIKRHDAAVRKIVRALQRRTRQGGCYTIMDACKAADLGKHGVSGKRLPGFILPTEESDGLEKKRPDVLRILNLPANPTAADIETATRNKADHPVQVVEVGFTQDTRFAEKMAEKQAQHAELVRLLQQAGWPVSYHVILVGVAGTVYKSGSRALRELGMGDKDARALLRNCTCMHWSACTTLCWRDGSLNEIYELGWADR